jgi:2-amino-4-hydroxy-6-hydroxymethyldihydropteridine diphosphokinase
LDRAVEALAHTLGIRVLRTSQYYETVPVGGPPEQGMFLNAAVEIESDLSPPELLEACQRLEAEAGRVRTERWGPRTLDVDILLYGEQLINAPELTIPHPRMHERRFVLEPLCEIAPELSHPVVKKTMRELLARERASLCGPRPAC